MRVQKKIRRSQLYVEENISSTNYKPSVTRSSRGSSWYGVDGYTGGCFVEGGNGRDLVELVVVMVV